MELMRNELAVLEKTDHPNITRVFELLEDKQHFYVVMEYMSEGNLLDKVVKCDHFTEDIAAKTVYQIMLALNYMHQQKITHRDLKPDNIMCQVDQSSEELTVKLTDFGFACFFDPNQKMDLNLGTPMYMAPELVNNDDYTEKVDVWALGCIVFILLTGQPPFYGENKEEMG